MCGFAGIIHRHAGQISGARLQQAAEALRHRGPDDHGIHIDGKVGLVHTRLSIIDLAGGHQPLSAPGDGLSLVANGEVYNYLELFSEWAAAGRHPLTRSDSEAILHSYACGGVEGFRRLNGMFAFALHDRPRQRLVLGRDRLGIKPLFYTVQPDFVAFASELQALLTLLPSTPALRPEALVQYLGNEFNSGPDTIFAGLKRLPPGHCLVIDADLQVELQAYWSATAVEPLRIDQREAGERFDALMSEVMTEHQRADVPFGLFLSGGVDSAVLCALLSRSARTPLATYSVGYADTPERNELDDARRIAERFGTRHTVLELSREDLYRRIPHAIHAADELMLDYATLPTSLLAERAARDLKVVFTGEGGDEVFAGYGRYRRHPVQRFFANLGAPGSGGFRTEDKWPAGLRRALFGAPLQAAAAARRRPFIEAWQRSPERWSALQRAQYTDLDTALPDNLLVKVDRALMGFGLEGRVPFLDHRIVEFGLALPDRLKVRGDTGKWFLREWATRLLPRDHLFKVKRGFHVPIARLFTPAVLTQLLGVLPANRGVREYFVPDAVRTLIRDQLAGKRRTAQLWAVFQFALWHRMFIEDAHSRPSPEEDPVAWLC